MSLLARLKLERTLLSALLIVAGLTHLFNPSFFLPMIPPLLPWPAFWVEVTGYIEIAAGMGLQYDDIRKVTAQLLIVYFITLLPVHFYMAIYKVLPGGSTWGSWSQMLLWARIPFQGAFIYWAWRQSHIEY